MRLLCFPLPLTRGSAIPRKTLISSTPPSTHGFRCDSGWPRADNDLFIHLLHARFRGGPAWSAVSTKQWHTALNNEEVDSSAATPAAHTTTSHPNE